MISFTRFRSYTVPNFFGLFVGDRGPIPKLRFTHSRSITTVAQPARLPPVRTSAEGEPIAVPYTAVRLMLGPASTSTLREPFPGNTQLPRSAFSLPWQVSAHPGSLKCTTCKPNFTLLHFVPSSVASFLCVHHTKGESTPTTY